MKQDLGRLLRTEEGVSLASIPELDMTQSMACAAAIISYLDLLADESNFGTYSISTFNFQQVKI